MTSGYDKLAELREKASPGPWTVVADSAGTHVMGRRAAVLFTTYSDDPERHSTQLAALSPTLAEVIGELRTSLEKIKTYGGVCENFELCHHRGCNDSYSAWAIADAALTNTDKKLGDALQPDREERR